MQILKTITSIIFITIITQFHVFGQNTNTETTVKKDFYKSLLACGDHFQITDQV